MATDEVKTPVTDLLESMTSEEREEADLASTAALHLRFHLNGYRLGRAGNLAAVVGLFMEVAERCGYPKDAAIKMLRDTYEAEEKFAAEQALLRARTIFDETSAQAPEQGGTTDAPVKS